MGSGRRLHLASYPGRGGPFVMSRLFRSPMLALLLSVLMVSAEAQTQNPPPQQPPSESSSSTQTPGNPPAMPNAPTLQQQENTAVPSLGIRTPPELAMPRSRNPFATYEASSVPEPNLSNSP